MARNLFGNLIRSDPLTRRKFSKKQLNRDKMEEIRRKGQAGEDSVKMKYQMAGYAVDCGLVIVLGTVGFLMWVLQDSL
jgi:hypothetical protein